MSFPENNASNLINKNFDPECAYIKIKHTFSEFLNLRSTKVPTKLQ